MSLHTRRNGIVLIVGLAAVFTVRTHARAVDDSAISYGRQIRPILAENCFSCHGQDPNRRKADLRLDTLEGQRSDGIVVPGQPDASELLQRILSDDPEEQMPPPGSNRHLSAEDKERIRRWIEQGAPFEGHWAFQTPVRPSVPVAPTASNPIDGFLRHRLEAEHIVPAPQADRRTLLRRITLELTGLPPTPAELAAFLADKSPAAYERQVDRLLASPRYGERMALPWLDAARYSDSNGFQQDGDTFQWVWRDWVVRALNTNMPFDQFTIEQIAGDLLPSASVDQKVATGFNRNHLLNGEGGAIPEEQRFNNLFDRVDATATNWLGLTMACAQCHDHKYDPITQHDYYAFLAPFNNLSESGTAPSTPTRLRVATPFVEAADPAHRSTAESLDKVAADLKSALNVKQSLWRERVKSGAVDADESVRKQIWNDSPEGKPDRDREIARHFAERIEPDLARLANAAEAEARSYRDEEIPRVMVMADDRPRITHVLERGDYLRPGPEVGFHTPAFLPPLAENAPRNRLGLAQWLVAPENPLTARVAVNRAWQTLFGTGLVKTSEDMGVQGDPPAHRELLDWLAVELRESGWNVKRLHRLIVTSETYQQASRIAPEQLELDPENRLYARFPRVRLPALLLRDLALAASGLLDQRIYGKPVYPYQPDGIWEPLAITKERDFTYPASKGPDLYRRSLYTFWRRTIGPADMFDASARQVCKVRPSVTNTPLHALTTLNNPAWVEAARVLAEHALLAATDTDSRLGFACQRILGRDPTPAELPILHSMLDQQLAVYRGDAEAARQLLSVGSAPTSSKLDAAEHAAWANLCLALFNMDEALNRE